jgi:hypothetical protein
LVSRTNYDDKYPHSNDNYQYAQECRTQSGQAVGSRQ